MWYFNPKEPDCDTTCAKHDTGVRHFLPLRIPPERLASLWGRACANYMTAPVPVAAKALEHFAELILEEQANRP